MTIIKDIIKDYKRIKSDMNRFGINVTEVNIGESVFPIFICQVPKDVLIIDSKEEIIIYNLGTEK